MQVRKSQRGPMLDRTDPIQGTRARRLPAITSPVNPSEREMPHVVVVGGGVAGLILATRLGHLLSSDSLNRLRIRRTDVPGCGEAQGRYGVPCRSSVDSCKRSAQKHAKWSNSGGHSCSNALVRDRAPKSRFGRQFPHTETWRHFAAGFETLHLRIVIREDS
jgi:hypothetical protein